MKVSFNCFDDSLRGWTKFFCKDSVKVQNLFCNKNIKIFTHKTLGNPENFLASLLTKARLFQSEYNVLFSSFSPITFRKVFQLSLFTCFMDKRKGLKQKHSYIDMGEVLLHQTINKKALAKQKQSCWNFCLLHTWNNPWYSMTGIRACNAFQWILILLPVLTV